MSTYVLFLCALEINNCRDATSVLNVKAYVRQLYKKLGCAVFWYRGVILHLNQYSDIIQKLGNRWMLQCAAN